MEHVPDVVALMSFATAAMYAETSAVLRWLLNQQYAEQVRLELERADRVVASCLTPLECRRVLARLTPS
jgi:hypothetical protein